MALAHDAANTELVAYLPNNTEIQIDFSSLGFLAKNGRWFDPRTGQFLDSRYAQGTRVASSQTWRFCRPCGTPSPVSCPLPIGTPARPACPASANPGDPGADYVLVID